LDTDGVGAFVFVGVEVLWLGPGVGVAVVGATVVVGAVVVVVAAALYAAISAVVSNDLFVISKDSATVRLPPANAETKYNWIFGLDTLYIMPKLASTDGSSSGWSNNS
jgi:hypothetical protein